MVARADGDRHLRRPGPGQPRNAVQGAAARRRRSRTRTPGAPTWATSSSTTTRFQTLFGESPENVNVRQQRLASTAWRPTRASSPTASTSAARTSRSSTPTRSATTPTPRRTGSPQDLAAAHGARREAHLRLRPQAGLHLLLRRQRWPVRCRPSRRASTSTPPARDAFWNVIEQYGATYFCGHEHIFNISQPRGDAAASPGRSSSARAARRSRPLPTDATVCPATDRDYAWATVEITQERQGEAHRLRLRRPVRPDEGDQAHRLNP